jgi:2,4-dienoyl-CoA reductase-like NADH-dependent reductase (Old Yellow Enzyme family)
MLTGSRAAGGFGLVFPEQIAITADGRTSVHCAGIWEDGQIEGLARITRIVKEMGGATPTRRGARSTQASSGLRCTSRTATSASSPSSTSAAARRLRT